MIAGVSGHGALYLPIPRNSADKSLPAFTNGSVPSGGSACTCANGLEKETPDGQCTRGLREAADGQSCLWWSQGCSIGCETCATADGGTDPITGSEPHADKMGFRVSYCEEPSTNATLPRYAWTMNVDAVEGAEEDSYRFNPWRAPGSAPVVDACGQAGGKYPQTPVGGDSVFVNTSIAGMGDLASEVLAWGAAGPPASWTAGSAVEVMWGIRYNHGGGYQYRLCPADSEPTEECFQEHVLEFDRTKQALVWNNGTRFPIEGTWVDEGTVPAGSTWAMNPIPRTNDDNTGLHDPESCPGPDGRSGPGCTQFTPPCPQDTGPFDWATDGSGQGACSGDWTMGLIADTVKIPDDLPPGQFVLQWRWDCEETAQIWANCADVEIISIV